jgi:hypothetical protein
MGSAWRGYLKYENGQERATLELDDPSLIEIEVRKGI